MMDQNPISKRDVRVVFIACAAAILISLAGSYGLHSLMLAHLGVPDPWGIR